MSSLYARDLAGQKFGTWTAVRTDFARSAAVSDKEVYWLCECECGAPRSLTARNLINGNVPACRECTSPKEEKPVRPRKSRFIDLAGQQIGSWLVLEMRKRFNNRKHGRVYWLCRCVCGNEVEVESYSLRSGKSTQCRECKSRKQTKT